MAGFTLVEVVVSVAILALVIHGVLLGYAASAQRAEWNAHSLAAQALASQCAEQARSAKWDTQAWPQGVGAGQPDELGVTNYMQTDTLDIAASGPPLIVTNFVSITAVSLNPPVRQIRSECVWRFMDRGRFTNTVTLLRASDQ